MAQESHYQLAGKTLEKLEKGEKGTGGLDSAERMLAAAQIDAILAVAHELALLRQELSRAANALETAVPEQIAAAADLVRGQIRAFAP